MIVGRELKPRREEEEETAGCGERSLCCVSRQSGVSCGGLVVRICI